LKKALINVILQVMGACVFLDNNMETRPRLPRR
jgi:hypothetical protein